MFYVERWFRKVLPKLANLTYSNGGPIILAQVKKTGVKKCFPTFKERVLAVIRKKFCINVVTLIFTCPR